MSDKRHNTDLTVYLCGDHSDPQSFYYADREITLLTDYTVINPTKGEQAYSLLERLEMIHYADTVVVLINEFQATPASMTEIWYAQAEGVDTAFLANFLEPYEIVRDCD